MGKSGKLYESYTAEELSSVKAGTKKRFKMWHKVLIGIAVVFIFIGVLGYREEKQANVRRSISDYHIEAAYPELVAARKDNMSKKEVYEKALCKLEGYVEKARIVKGNATTGSDYDRYLHMETDTQKTLEALRYLYKSGSL